jgi:hypothetical protein
MKTQKYSAQEGGCIDSEGHGEECVEIHNASFEEGQPFGEAVLLGVDECDILEVSVGGESDLKLEGGVAPARSSSQTWNMFGYAVPKQEVVFFSQVIILYIVILIGLVNIILDKGDKNLWLSLLSGSIGYLLPNPSLKKETIIVHRSVL